MYYLEPLEETSEKLTSLIAQLKNKEEEKIYIKCTNSHIFSAQLRSSFLIVRQNSIDTEQKQEISASITDTIPQNIAFGFFNRNDAFLICQNPFCIYYITDGAPLIKIQLEKEIHLTEAVYTVKQTSLYVFGWNQMVKRNQIYEISLQTLAIKSIQHSKTYGPQNRTGYGALVCEDRLYLFGGKNVKGQYCDKINWVYDFEKGSWFGLQMIYPDEIAQNKPFVSQWNTRKAIVSVEGKQGIWIFELHQSKIKKVEVGQKNDKQMDLKGNVICLGGQVVEMKGNEINQLRKMVDFRKQKK